jgi:DNA-binding response OmpR family regulator
MRVCLVECGSGTAEPERAVLDAAGYDVCVVECEALLAAPERLRSCVIVLAGALGGIAALPVLKTLSERTEHPVIVVSAHCSPAEAAKLLKAGAADIVESLDRQLVEAIGALHPAIAA